MNFEQVRGLAGVRRATIDLDGFELKVGIAHGLGNARQLLEDIRHGRNEYHVIEIMACPGGCIGGGGQTVASWQLGGAVCTCQCTVSGKMHRSLCVNRTRIHTSRLCMRNIWVNRWSETAERLLHTHYFNKAID